jgi:hypothetical protein
MNRQDFYNVFYVENSSAVHSDMWALNDYISNVPGEELQIFMSIAYDQINFLS